MRLAVHESGSGTKTAVLIHGIMSDSRAWHRVTAELEAQGFRVLAVDLAGHGRSPRALRYSPAAWASDVVETLEPLLDGPPDIVMGHSLGGLVASLVADRLAPRAAIYIDPAFSFPKGVKGWAFKAFFAVAPRPRRPVSTAARGGFVRGPRDRPRSRGIRALRVRPSRGARHGSRT